MKVGDLVKCKGDPGMVFGLGLIVEEETRMVRVWWNDQQPTNPDTEWIWKTNLEVVNP